MNVLHEPWNDDALSEDMSWGPAQKLAQATMADELADTATTQAVQNAQLAYTAAADAGDPAALAAAEAALQQAQSEVLLPAGPGLCRGHCQNIELGVSMRGPTVGGLAVGIVVLCVHSRSLRLSESVHVEHPALPTGMNESGVCFELACQASSGMHLQPVCRYLLPVQ